MWILALAAAWAECTPEETLEHQGTQIHLAGCPGENLTIIGPDGTTILTRDWYEMLTPVERAAVQDARDIAVEPHLEEGFLNALVTTNAYSTHLHVRLEDGARIRDGERVSVLPYEALLSSFIDGSVPYDYVSIVLWDGATPQISDQGLRIDRGTRRACMLQSTATQCLQRSLLGTRSSGRAYMAPSFRTLLKSLPELTTRLSPKGHSDEQGSLGIRLTYGVDTPEGVAAWTWEARGDDPVLRKTLTRLIRFGRW